MDGFDATLLPLLFKRLAALDSKVAQWKGDDRGRFPGGPPEITPETPQTMQRYGEARRFRGSDSQPKIFEEHVWVDRLFRIHLFRDFENRTMEIGYMGRHLPTIRNPT